MADSTEAKDARPEDMSALLATTARAALADPTQFAPARRAVAAVSRALPGADAAVFLRSRWGPDMFCVASSGDSGPDRAADEQDDRLAILQVALSHSGPLILDGRERAAPGAWRELGFDWAVCSRFSVRQQAFGGMVVRGRGEGGPGPATVSFLDSLAGVAALGLVAHAPPPAHGHEQEVSAALDALVRAQEEERARISRELHDETGQSLTSLLLALKLLSQKAGDGAIAQDVAELREQVVKTLDGLHRVAQGLRPLALDELGLGAALQTLCDEFTAQHGIRTSTYHLDRNCPCRSDAIDIALYRIVQEALTNVARHAEATHVSVVLTCHGGLVTVQVEDDGKGSAAEEEAWDPGHLGILGMNERAALLGGKVRVESSPGQGTTVYAELPADYVVPEGGYEDTP